MRSSHIPLCTAILLAGCSTAFGFTGNWNPGFWGRFNLGLVFTIPMFFLGALLVSVGVSIYMAKRRETEGTEKKVLRTFGKTFVCCIPIYLLILFVLAVIDIFV